MLGKLGVSQAKVIDLLTQFLFHIDVVLTNLLEFAVLLFELGLSLGRYLFLNSQHFFEDVHVLLEGAGYLLILLKFVREEDFDVS